MTRPLHVFGRTLYEDGSLTPSEFAVFRQSAEFLRRTVPLIPTCVVFVDADVTTALMRVDNRGRGEERGVTAAYLEQLKDAEYKWYHHQTNDIPHRIYLDGEGTAEEIFAELMTHRSQLESVMTDPLFV